MKWSAPLVTGSIGTRTGALQLWPPDELLRTMSLPLHFARKRQSSQATYALPEASISALGSGLVRNPPAFGWNWMVETSTPLLHEAPPLVERKASIFPLRLSKGTITVPSGPTTGCPPRPLSLPAVEIGTLQFLPPSAEVLMYSRSPSPKLSNSV